MLPDFAPLLTFRWFAHQGHKIWSSQLRNQIIRHESTPRAGREWGSLECAQQFRVFIFHPTTTQEKQRRGKLLWHQGGKSLRSEKRRKIRHENAKGEFYFATSRKFHEMKQFFLFWWNASNIFCKLTCMLSAYWRTSQNFQIELWGRKFFREISVTFIKLDEKNLEASRHDGNVRLASSEVESTKIFVNLSGVNPLNVQLTSLSLGNFSKYLIEVWRRR